MNGYYLSGGLYFLILILSSASCNNDAPKEELDKPVILSGALNFELINFERQLATCQADTANCAIVRAVYPRAKTGNEIVCTNINDTVFYYLRESLSVLAVSREEVLQSLDSIANQFFLDYDETVIHGADYMSPWTVETIGEVLLQSEEVVSIALANYSSTGGAHPNNYTTLLNFDAETGRKLQLNDVFEDLDLVKEIVEKKFRAAHELEAGEDLNEAGFFWDQDFYLPANFALTEEGYYFYYNAYEAAAYAIGATALIVTKEDLMPIEQ